MNLFAFNEELVRIATRAGEPVFVAVDVCRGLGIENQNDAVRDIVPDQEKCLIEVQTAGGIQSVVALTEPGLYRLIFRSDKPQAELFRSWVFGEVLPSIRKTGSYGAASATQERLWKAFEQAKTGKVQLLILEALKVVGLQEEVRVLKQKVANLPQIEDTALWTLVEEGIGTGAINSTHLAVEVVHYPGTTEHKLFIRPEVFLQALWTREPKLMKHSRADLRLLMGAQPGWLEGKHRRRFGTRTEAVWAFRITADSSPVLQRICGHLVQAATAPARN